MDDDHRELRERLTRLEERLATWSVSIEARIAAQYHELEKAIASQSRTTLSLIALLTSIAGSVIVWVLTRSP